MRALDHLVLCVRDLEKARAAYRSFGFTLTPVARHPFGTCNSLVQLQGNFLELLSIGDPAAIPPPAPEHFSFGAYNAEFLEKREGMSMLVFQGEDARADVAAFRARGLDTYEPFDFGRDAKLPDGRTVRVAFSLAFVTHADMPEAVFFTCQQHAPEHFWKPDYQRHENGAARVVEIVMSAPEPARFADFFARLVDDEPVLTGDALRIGHIRVMRDAGIPTPRFVGYRVAVAALEPAARLLERNGVKHQAREGAIVIPPREAFGVAIELVRA